MKKPLLLATAAAVLLTFTACVYTPPAALPPPAAAPPMSAGLLVDALPAPAVPLPAPVAAADAAGAALQSAARPDGSTLYASYCQSCHQASGLGVPGVFPALRGSPVVRAAAPDQLIGAVLRGYDARADYGLMPGFAASLSDAQIAAIATYVRGTWGPAKAAVPPAVVSRHRATSPATAAR